MTRKPPIITGFDVTEFEYTLPEMGQTPVALVYQKGGRLTVKRRVLRVFTDAGVTGEYFGGSAMDYSALPQLAELHIGRSALAREEFSRAAKLPPKLARLGTAQFDIALWDLAGKWCDVPVYQLLGGHRTALPTYASTWPGDDEPDGLSSPEAYADFAEQCLAMGYRAFKIHPWGDAPIEKHVALVRAVGQRVGGRMDLMLDPFNAIHTFGDAVKLGRACDEYGFFWWEDPFRDGGVSAFAHRKLRQLVRTPLLQLEQVRGLEAHVDFIVADGTDFVRIDPDYDGGITGVMKIGHAAEGFGLDVEPHTAGPSRRQVMAATWNCNYYEQMGVHPRIPEASHGPVYLDGYSDRIDAIDANGCVPVPEGPGLGVTLNWEYIERHKTGRVTYP